ncbi:hypothetical protein HC891_26520, partial [Candidatus Gracilibacteria bacterium]|nr:hypothetical protein [Candidatus Gracilibacteria bacterium]
MLRRFGSEAGALFAVRPGEDGRHLIEDADWSPGGGAQSRGNRLGADIRRLPGEQQIRGRAQVAVLQRAIEALDLFGQRQSPEQRAQHGVERVVQRRPEHAGLVSGGHIGVAQHLL